MSSSIVLEDNQFVCVATGDVNGGNFIASYDLYHHSSSWRWSVARNLFTRPFTEGANTWQFHETLTTDAPHSYNMGPVVAILPGVLPAVSLSPRMRPLVGATLIALGGPGNWS